MTRDKFFENTKIQNGAGFRIENNILKGDEVHFNVNYNNVGRFVLDKLESNPDAPSQIDTATGKVYACKEVRERSVRCALWMRSQGLLPRDVVAICSEHHLDAALPYFASLYLGATFSLSSTSLEIADFHHRFTILGPKMIFVSENAVAAVTAAVKAAKIDPKIIVFGQSSGFLDFESAIAEPSADQVRNFECTPIESSRETASIMFSAGTTGLSKAAEISHASLLMQACATSEQFGMAGKICLHFGIFDWITAIHFTFMSLCLGIPRLIVKAFEEQSACALMEKYKVNWVFMSPSMINKLVKSNALETHDLSSLNRFMYAGAPLSATSYEALVKHLPKAQITGAYGMTELGGYLAIQPTNSRPDQGSCGKILENAQVKVIDPDSGRILGTGEKGELLLRTAFMINSYYKNPEATAKIIDKEGWIHSGDLGYYDENGNIFVIDRMKELIKYHDHHIYPSEIESLLLTHPRVKEVAVVGQPRPGADDRLMAFVVTTVNSYNISNEVIRAELVDLVAAELSDYKQLRGGVSFLEHMPKSPAGKIRREKLRQLARYMLRAEAAA
ncbi:luciferin 4-monooxygenase-like isoform X1 [Neodiprion virginianus]|uniref:luciferin 4-monooxygenase-like isoform X1 n=2 Tax=Neodiprion virginianus TaxID=2961670 RepID=UPI001EE6BCB9|nr:luciferin 4-monooxygenase-like isoform X1 [Neodiprion virginianus]